MDSSNPRDLPKKEPGSESSDDERSPRSESVSDSGGDSRADQGGSRRGPTMDFDGTGSGGGSDDSSSSQSSAKSPNRTILPGIGSPNAPRPRQAPRRRLPQSRIVRLPTVGSRLIPVTSRPRSVPDRYRSVDFRRTRSITSRAASSTTRASSSTVSTATSSTTSGSRESSAPERRQRGQRRRRQIPRRRHPVPQRGQRAGQQRPCKIFVWGFGDVDVDALRRRLSRFGPVQHIRINRTPRRNNNTADIYFRTKKAAMLALRAIRSRKLYDSFGIASAIMAARNPRAVRARASSPREFLNN